MFEKIYNYLFANSSSNNYNQFDIVSIGSDADDKADDSKANNQTQPPTNLSQQQLSPTTQLDSDRVSNSPYPVKTGELQTPLTSQDQPNLDRELMVDSQENGDSLVLAPEPPVDPNQADELELEERKLRKKILKKYCRANQLNLDDFHQKMPLAEQSHVHRGKIRRINQPRANY